MESESETRNEELPSGGAEYARYYKAFVLQLGIAGNYIFLPNCT